MTDSLVKIEDIFGAGKAGEKLSDVVSRGIGRLYDDWASPHAEVRKIKMLSAAETQSEHYKTIQRTESLLEADELVKRAGKRLLVQEVRRQNTIDRVISLTSENLKDTDVSEEPVSTDWATRFFEAVKDISDENVQELWAKILAGEIKKPGTFSVRTLEVLRNITQNEAKIFLENICPLVFVDEYIIKIDNESDLKKFGLTYEHILFMRDAGLVLEGDSTVKEFRDIENKTLQLSTRVHTVIVKSTKKDFNLPVLLLTPAGREIYKIQKFLVNTDYIKAVDEYLKTSGFVDVTFEGKESTEK